MLWTKVKEEVARIVRHAVLHGATDALVLLDLIKSDWKAVRRKGKNQRDALEVYADRAYEAVMAWDIRGSARLRELFPQHFPKTLRSGTLVAEMGEKGWILTITHERNIQRV